MDAVAPEAVSSCAPTRFAAPFPRFSGSARDVPGAPPDALATLLAGFGRVPAEVIVDRWIRCSCAQTEDTARQHEERDNPSSHSGHSLAGSDGGPPGEVPGRA